MIWTKRSVLPVVALAFAAVGLVLAQEPEGPTPSPDGLPDLSGRVVQKIRSSADRPAPGSRSRYGTLLRKLEIPADQATFGDFCDYGYWSGTQYAGHDDLPPGYWVYLAPNWYIFKDELSRGQPAAKAPRPWGPEQATGAPDTWPNAGDIQTAWASKTPDGQREWLELTYAAPVRAIALTIYETYNPGAVDRVTTFDADGNELELWSGADPTPADHDKGISIIPVHPTFDLTRIRIYLDSPKVAGWNEIDAVGLLDAGGTTRWAASATASSTYADLVGQGAPAGEPELPDVRLR